MYRRSIKSNASILFILGFVLAGLVSQLPFQPVTVQAATPSGSSLQRSSNRTLPNNDASSNMQRPIATTVSSDITSNTTWTLANSPYQVSNARVMPGVILTIEPGVEVRFDSFGGLEVQGTILANGTVAQPITFTGTTKQQGWWSGIRVIGTSTVPLTGSVFNNVIIEDAGVINAGSNLDITYATVNISNGIIRNSIGDGISSGVKGVANLANVTFTGNKNYALRISDGSSNPVLSNLSASGNGFDAIGIGPGTLTGSNVWESAGIPYLVYSGVTVAPGSSLTIEPGTVVQFGQYQGLEVHGTLTAIGTPGQPITFTGTTKQVGWWSGIHIAGTATSILNGSVIKYATVEYGGYFNGLANIHVENAIATITNSIIRFSSQDGINLGTNAFGSLIEANQISGNTNYGVHNMNPARTALAANNWWGSTTGPALANGCNPGGTGDKVSAGVAFRPFLTSATATPDPLAPSDARNLQLTPASLFVPADAVSRDYITITLRDGSGQPLPGRTVHLISTRGTVVDGGITDVQGKTYAYVTSSTAGDADLVATLDLQNSCESARSAISTLTFTPVPASGDLVPDTKAPYLSNGIQINPLPVMVGVSTTLSVKLVNPNAIPITVNGTFGIAQLGLGLTFGPIGQVQNLTIPANGTATAQIIYIPAVSGHYCFQFEYSYVTPNGPTPMNRLAKFVEQHNIDAEPAPFMSPSDKDVLNKAKDYTNRIDNGSTALTLYSDGAKGYIGGYIPGTLFGKILDFCFSSAETISRNLGGDPPRQDYTVIASLHHYTFTPLQPGANLPAARAQAENDLMTALLDMVDKGQAASISLDRYTSAAQNNSLTWESQQAAAFFYYKQQYGQAMITTAAKLDALRQELLNEGFTDITASVDTYKTYQQRLSTQGYTAEEIQAAHSIGLTDADIEQIRQATITQDPNLSAGSQIQKLGDLANAYRAAGNMLLNPPLIGGITYGGGHATASAGNNLARIYRTNYTVEVGNPLTQTATIDLRIRRVDVPNDWNISAPASVTLPAGAHTTVTVTVDAGSAVAQGMQAQIAIEGYNNNILLGGTMLEVDVPQYVAFNGNTGNSIHVYIPVSLRSVTAGW